MFRFSTLVLVATALVPVAATVGCGSLFNQHAQMMDAMRGAMSDTAARLSTSGAGQLAAGGQVINPGLRVCGGVEYYAEARYEGVSGQVLAAMSGTLDRPVPQDVQERIDAVWRETSLSSQQKLELTYDLLSRWLLKQQSEQVQASGPAR